MLVMERGEMMNRYLACFLVGLGFALIPIPAIFTGDLLTLITFILRIGGFFLAVIFGILALLESFRMRR